MQTSTLSSFSRKMQKFAESGGYNLILDKKLTTFKYMGCLKISHIFKDFDEDYKAKLYYELDEIVKAYKLSAYELRWLPKEHNKNKLDTVAFVCFRHNEDHLQVIKELDGKWMGDEEDKEGKFLAVKPNGFTNEKVNPIFPQTNFKKQEAAVKMFNNRHYVADKTNERNATPLAVARILVKEEDDESEDRADS